jgi:hypothetical protein
MPVVMHHSLSTMSTKSIREGGSDPSFQRLRQHKGLRDDTEGERVGGLRKGSGTQHACTLAPTLHTHQHPVLAPLCPPNPLKFHPPKLYQISSFVVHDVAHTLTPRPRSASDVQQRKGHATMGHTIAWATVVVVAFSSVITGNVLALPGPLPRRAIFIDNHVCWIAS